MFINKALKGFKFGNAEKEQWQPKGGRKGGTTATMEHNDAINNKQASWEACKLFRLKLKLGTSHKTHTKLCRIQRKTPAKVYATRFPFPYSPRSGIVPGICAAKKFKCLCEINCCASPPVPTPTKSAFPSPTTSPFPSPTPAYSRLLSALQWQPYSSQNKAIACTRKGVELARISSSSRARRHVKFN